MKLPLNGSLILRCLGIALPLLMMAGTLVFFTRTAREVSVYANVMPLDSYYYQSFASNIQKGNGPRTDWPQGPQNKYFPGYSYWWALFLPKDMHPDQALRHYLAPQVVLLLLLMVAAVILGRAAWRDWPVALSFAALASASPILLKWGFVPLSEMMAATCLTALAAAFAFLYQNKALELASLGAGAGSRMKDGVAVAALILVGGAGALTRLECAYFIGMILLVLVWMKRMRWTTGAAIGVAAMLPLAIWQMWTTQTFHQASYYVGEGTRAFRMASFLNQFFYEMLNFVKVQEVVGSSAFAATVLVVVHLVFICALVLALRGYSGRLALIFAWTVIGYWLLHALWYYKTERYNLLVIPFGFLFFVEGMGRLYHFGRGWLARGGRVLLPLLTLVLVPVFWGHASDNIWQMVAAFNQQKRFPENARAIADAFRPDLPNRKPVILTTISLPEARRLPGVVWFDGVFSKDPCSDLLPPLYPEGMAQAFIRDHKVTHLALRPPVEEWMARNGAGLDVTPIYSDSMVWIGRIGRLP